MNEQLSMATKLHREQKFSDAEKLYREHLAQHPANGKILMALAHACYMQGHLADSIECLENARRIDATDPEIHHTLGNLRAESGSPQQAMACYRETLRLKPDHAGAWLGLGSAQYHIRHYAAAIESFSEATRLNPSDARGFHNLGLALMRVGRAEEAGSALHRAKVLDPDNAAIHTCALFNLHNIPGLTNQEIYDEHLRWAARFAVNTPAAPARRARTSAGAPLRVGYVSPDFRQHSVFFFIHPVLKSHDRTAVTSYCYADVERPDNATRQLMDAADHWRDISHMDDQHAFQSIQHDEIDILVDLAGHTHRNRLRLFSRRAAPVQISWLGYPGTTGLRTMDYRLTDAQADPEGTSDRFHTERLVRLKHGFLCYEPPADAPMPVNAPAIRNGFITFGSFNNLAKINSQVISAWAKILQRVPGARLVLKAPGLDDEAGRATVLSGLRHHGIGRERIECLGYMSGTQQHLAAYNRIDLALDTFPYNGTTTTCEALWMGVPVVTFAGDRHAWRVGTSILAALGMTECVGTSYDDYINLAVRFGCDKSMLNRIRSGLRERMQGSPLMDASAFCRILETKYREMTAR